jgi:hypothetical protein
VIDSDDDLDAVRRLMQEAGLENDDALTPVVLELRALAHATPPPPSAAVAALMTGRPRRRAGRTGVVIALAVTASLGAGLTAAAASPAVRDRAASAVAALGSPTIQRPALPTVEVGTPVRSTEHRSQGSATPAGTPAAHASSVPVPLDSAMPDDGQGHGQSSKRADPAAAPSPARSAEAADSHRHGGGSGSSGRGGGVTPTHSGQSADQAKDDGKGSDDAGEAEADG